MNPPLSHLTDMERALYLRAEQSYCDFIPGDLMRMLDALAACRAGLHRIRELSGGPLPHATIDRLSQAARVQASLRRIHAITDCALAVRSQAREPTTCD